MPVNFLQTTNLRGERTAKFAAKKKIKHDSRKIEKEVSSSSTSSSEEEDFYPVKVSPNDNKDTNSNKSTYNTRKRKHNETSSDDDDVPTALIAKDDPEDEYFVEKIIDMELRGDERLFFVKWQDYSDEHNSWEPESNMTGCKELIKEFSLISKKSKDEQPKLNSSKTKVDQVDEKPTELIQIDSIQFQENLAPHLFPGGLVFVFRVWVSNQVKFLHLDLSKKTEDVYYNVVVTEDLKGKDPKWLYGATEGLDGKKYCLVQFEGNEYIDVVPPINLIGTFPYVKNFYSKELQESISV